MRILYILPSISVRGASIPLKQASLLAQNGHEIIITTLDNNEDDKKNQFFTYLQDVRKEFDKFDVIIGYTPVCAFYINDIETNASKFCLLLNDEKDLITKEFLEKTTKLNDYQIIDEVQNTKSYIEKSYRIPLGYLLPNRRLKSSLEKKKSRSYLVPIGIDTEEFYPDQYIPKNNTTRILTETSNMHWSGTETINRCLSDMRNFELWTTGSKVIKSDKHWGKLNGDMLRKVISSCDIYINIDSIDGTGEKILQAMACGVVVVCKKTHGSRMFCKDGINCIFISGSNQKEESENLKKALEELIKDNDLRNKLISGGFETVQNNSWDIKYLEEAICLKQ